MAIFITTAVLVALWAAPPAYGNLLDIKVVLQADTGLYLCRINRGNYLDPIEADGTTPDVKCRYTVVKNTDGTYSFIADNARYIGRVYRNNEYTLEAIYTTIGSYSSFNVINHGSAKISLRDNLQNYANRIDSGSGSNPVKLTGNSAEASNAQFTVKYMELGGKMYERTTYSDYYQL